MSRDSIARIKEAEAEAARMIAEAETRAAAMLADAERRGNEYCRRSEETCRAELAATLFAIRERTDALDARMEEETAEELNALRNQAAMRKRIAEKIILRGVEAKCR